MSGMREINDHILIIAPPFQGHINPSIQLALKLASKGFTITFVNTHHIHHQIQKARNTQEELESGDDIFARTRNSGMDIRYRTISDGFPLSFDRSLHRQQFLEGRMHVFPAHVDELVEQLAGSDLPPTCLIADTFSTWGDDIARKYGLVFVSFFTQPALVWNLYLHLHLLISNGHCGSKDNRKDTIDNIPGVAPLEPSDLISYLQELDISKSNVVNRFFDKFLADAVKADFIICNTVEELEPEPISILKERQPTYAIGPLIQSHVTNRAVGMNLWPESDCSSWLDSKPPGSVVYASLGSYANISKDDIKTLANGLMLSGINFVWVLRPGIVSSEETDILPNGFRENVGGRGLVVPWCKQSVVISHSAVGGFLMHCGWNSILESVLAGVPMLCYPLLGDQITNRKLVVQDWKIGINLCRENLVSCDEVAENIRILMGGETSRVLRTTIEVVRKKLENAFSENGTSKVNFDKFVEDVKAKTHERRKTEVLLRQGIIPY